MQTKKKIMGTFNVIFVGFLVTFSILGCATKPKEKTYEEKQKPVVEKPVKPKVVVKEEPVLTDPDLIINHHIVKFKKGDENFYIYNIELNNTDTKMAQIELTNVGDKTLLLHKINITNDPQKHFSFQSKCPKALNKNESCFINVTFNSDYKGVYKSKIEIFSNSNGVIKEKARIKIKGTAKDLKTTGIFSVSAKKNDYKELTTIAFYKEGDKGYAAIRNNGIKPINIHGFKFMGEKKFTYSHNCPKVLKPNNSCEINFTYIKKDGSVALAYLQMLSDSVSSPSDTIKLMGAPLVIQVSKDAPEIAQIAAKDGMQINILDSDTKTENIDMFLEDFAHVNSKYYYRIIFQSASTQKKFKKALNEMIKYHFRKNGYTLVKNPVDADKIINIYPSIHVSRNKNHMIISTLMKVIIITKTSGYHLKNLNFINLDYDSDTEKSLNSIKFQNGQQNVMIKKLKFDYNLEAKHFSDPYFVYAVSSVKTTEFLFNLLGLK
jgi:hypothetical protein